MTAPLSVYLVDIDGTVALRDEARPNCRGPFDWDRVGEDVPNHPVIEVVRALAAAGNGVVYLSGRSDVCRRATQVWLAAHVGVPGEALLMRCEFDRRKDTVTKRELYDRHIRPQIDRGAWRVVAVLDDRTQVVRMWRSLGLTVLQVADGNF